MKTHLTAAAALMMLAAAATALAAAPVRVGPVMSPRPAAGSTPPVAVSARAAALEVVRIKELPVTWLNPVESLVGVTVEIPVWVTGDHRVQVVIDGDLAVAGYMLPGSSQAFRAEMKSDGRQHQMTVLVYRRIMDGPEVLARSAQFVPWLPAQ